MKPPVFLALLILTPISLFAQGEPQGTIKATTKLRVDGTRATTIVDPDKRTAEETLTDSAGKVLKRTVFPLNDRNFATGAIHYDAKGNVRYKESYTRDASERIVESQLFSKDDQPVGKRIFHYDARGTAQIEDYDASGKLIVRPAPPRPGRPDKKRRR